MSAFAFPYKIGPEGRTEAPTPEAYVRDLIELILFTAPGERVNRPDFGAGMRDMIFSENAPELATSARHLVHGALQRFLPTWIEVRSVEVLANEAQLQVTVQFSVVETGVSHTVTVEGGK